MATATFAAGCFWGVEATFSRIEGVNSTVVGYMGGTLENPSYQDVCTDETGHAEVVQIDYDPAQISYEELLQVFWQSHDPTSLNRQGVDVGSQYRSAIFYHTLQQEEMAKAMKEQLKQSQRFHQPIVTEIVPATTFYRAEEYHQRYLEKQNRSHCSLF